MGERLAPWLARASLLSMGVLLLSVSGLWPALQGEVPAPVSVSARPLQPPPAQPAPSPPAVGDADAQRPALPATRLCAAPAGPLAAWPLTLPGTLVGFAVWCRGGFEVWALEDGEAPLRRAATLPVSLVDAASGGVAAGDLDGDGRVDLVAALGVQERVHAPGAGVFWVRRDEAGAFAAARALIEAPVVGLAFGPLVGGGGAELVAQTRGDRRANRPSEGWLFSGSAAPRRLATLRAGPGPCGVAVRDLDGDGTLDVALCTEEGLRLHFGAGDGTFPRGGWLPMAGARELVAPAHGPLWVRADRRLFRITGPLKAGDHPAPEPWASLDASGLGLAAGDMDGDGAADALLPTGQGVVWLAGGEAAGAPAALRVQGTRVEAALVLRSPGGGARGLLIARDTPAGPGVYAVALPPLPWAAKGTYRLEIREPRQAALLVKIPLE